MRFKRFVTGFEAVRRLSLSERLKPGFCAITSGFMRGSNARKQNYLHISAFTGCEGNRSLGYVP